MPDPEKPIVPVKPIFDEAEAGDPNPKADPLPIKTIVTPESPGRPSQSVIIPSIPWYKSPNVLVAIGGIAAGVVAFCKAFHIPFPFTEAELGMGVAAIISIGSSGWFLYKRIRYGLDPNSPARRLTG
jgi:hypothetical protein